MALPIRERFRAIQDAHKQSLFLKNGSEIHLTRLDRQIGLRSLAKFDFARNRFARRVQPFGGMIQPKSVK
jgi:hypothetical protein